MVDLNEVEADQTSGDDVSSGQNQSPDASPVTNTTDSRDYVDLGDTVEPPRVGMVFSSWKAVERYYKKYAKQEGFGIIRPSATGSQKVGCGYRNVIWRYEMAKKATTGRRVKLGRSPLSGVASSAEGSPIEVQQSKRPKKSKKCECKAMLYASANNNGEWVVKNVVLEHTNHSPSPSKWIEIAQHRKEFMTPLVRRRLLKDFEAGVPVAKIHECLTREREGESDLNLTVRDMLNEVAQYKRLQLADGDANAMTQIFDLMHSGSQDLYHVMRMDKYGMLQDVLWIDARCKAHTRSLVM